MSLTCNIRIPRKFPLICGLFFLSSALPGPYWGKYSSELQARPAPIHFSTTTERLAIGQLMEVLEEGKTPLDLKDIRTLPDARWKRQLQDRIVVGLNEDPLWFRFRVKSSEKFVLSFLGPKMDHIELYIPAGDGEYIKKVTGDTHKYNSRDLKDRNFSFLIKDSSGAEFYYIRLDNHISYIGGIISLFSFNAYQDFILTETLALGLYLGFLVVMCLYNLFIYFSARERAFFFYSVFIFMNLCFSIILESVGFQFIYPDYPWIHNQGLLIVAPLVVISALVFSGRYLNFAETFPRALKIIQVLIIIHLAQIPFSLYGVTGSHPQQYLILSNYLLLLSPLFLLCSGIYLAWRGNRAAKFFLTAWLMLLLGSFIRILSGGKIIPQGFFSQWSIQLGSAMEVLLLSFGLADRINALKNNLARANEELESKVRERTYALSQSLQRVQELKRRQDGDYFLTSQLIRPLGSNNARSKRVKVDFLTRQKKRFTFRGKREEIGGDICVAENIELQDQTYTVVLNGDAMGKSLQGAGGALVLGSVFEAIVERTRETQGDHLSQKTPKQWLENAYRELHRVFETFAGGMLISMALGLLKEEEGILYLLNAEHPQSVLYRNSIASFLEDQLGLSKLGTTLPGKDLNILEIKLEPGDIVILGSDGRDDLIGNPGEYQGERYLIHDEDAFLCHVEESQANLRRIYKNIRKCGELIDDISLIRVEYRGSR